MAALTAEFLMLEPSASTVVFALAEVFITELREGEGPGSDRHIWSPRRCPGWRSEERHIWSPGAARAEAPHLVPFGYEVFAWYLGLATTPIRPKGFAGHDAE